VSQWEGGESQSDVGVTQWEVGVAQWEAGATVREIGIKGGLVVVTVEGWFITVVGAWWGGSAEQGWQIQPPTSPRKNMNLRVGPGNLEQVEWTHLLQQLYWTENILKEKEIKKSRTTISQKKTWQYCYL